MHHVLLIPGFFGFSNLGDVKYFRAVRETLERNFRQRGESVVVSGVKTIPTGSLKRRARRVVEQLRELRSFDEADHIHLVGHSTGGIDARMVASRTRDFQFGTEQARLREKLRSVITLSTPHYGTPLANFFTTLYGQKLLYLVTLLVFVGLWRRPIAVAGGLLGLGFKVTDLVGLNDTLIRQLTQQLLKDFTPERQREVREFLNSILTDVSLMIQLTPESMDVLNSALEPMDGPRFVSYATVAPPPLKVITRVGLRNLMTPLSTVLYTTLYSLTAARIAGYDYHPAVERREAFTEEVLPFDLDASSNDGVVPTLSQVHGEFRGIIKADHLDVVGHYLRGPLERHDGADWFTSGAKFSLDEFERLWGDATDVMLAGG